MFPTPEIDAIWTLGRLLREGRLEGFVAREILVEGWRRPNDEGRQQEMMPEPLFDSFSGCRLRMLDSPIERSRFRQTINLGNYLQKGSDTGEIEVSQVAFLQWLCKLFEADVTTILAHQSEIGLSDFEAESFRDLNRFRRLCQVLRSWRNYPDAFHIWTALRHDLDAFVTLDSRLRRGLKGLIEPARKTPELRLKVLLPTEILECFSVADLDRFPLTDVQFVEFAEAMALHEEYFGSPP